MFPIHPPQVLVFLFVLTRVSGLVLMAPLFGFRSTSWHTRGLLALAIALMITPISDWQLLSPLMANPWEVLAALCREAVLGLVLGTAIVLLVSAIQAAGQLIGQMSGMSLAEAVEPSVGSAATGFGKLFELTAIATFLLTGGHRQVLVALLDTFQWMPPGRVGFHAGLLATLQEVTAHSFDLALRACAPVLLALLLSALVIGVLNRLVPQINTLSVGFSMNMIVTMALVALTLGSMAWLFRGHVENTVAAVYEAMQSAPMPSP